MDTVCSCHGAIGIGTVSNGFHREQTTPGEILRATSNSVGVIIIHKHQQKKPSRILIMISDVLDQDWVADQN